MVGHTISVEWASTEFKDATINNNLNTTNIITGGESTITNGETPVENTSTSTESTLETAENISKPAVENLIMANENITNAIENSNSIKAIENTLTASLENTIEKENTQLNEKYYYCIAHRFIEGIIFIIIMNYKWSD